MLKMLNMLKMLKMRYFFLSTKLLIFFFFFFNFFFLLCFSFPLLSKGQKSLKTEKKVSVFVMYSSYFSLP